MVTDYDTGAGGKIYLCPELNFNLWKENFNLGLFVELLKFLLEKFEIHIVYQLQSIL